MAHNGSHIMVSCPCKNTYSQRITEKTSRGVSPNVYVHVRIKITALRPRVQLIRKRTRPEFVFPARLIGFRASYIKTRLRGKKPRPDGRGLVHKLNRRRTEERPVV